MESVDTVVINNIKYIVVDEILIDDVKYVYLAQNDDPTNFCIKKINHVNDMEYIVNLDSENEFKIALQKFYEKNHN